MRCAGGSRSISLAATSTAREIDCGLLAEVYLELLGGRQPGLDFAAPEAARGQRPFEIAACPPRPHAPSAEELAAHEAMLAMITTPLWRAEV